MPRQKETKSGTGIYHVMLGMKNNGTFGAIDDLTISYNGNRLVKVTDAAEALNDHGVGSTDHLSRQTMRIKTVMNHNQENDQKNRPHDHR